jgi:uncharacterized protein YbjT (DUF2867 family)
MLVQSKTLDDAAKKARVQHIVHLGVFGHWDCTDPHIAWHQLVETYIEASGIPWTHLHPNMFMEQIPRFMKIRNDRFRVFWGRDRMGWVASRDVGAAAATELREGPMKHSGQNYWLSVQVAGGDQLAGGIIVEFKLFFRLCCINCKQVSSSCIEAIVGVSTPD